MSTRGATARWWTASQAKDFQVFEDGKPQQVQAFEFIRSEPVTADADRRDPTSKEDGDRQAADPHNRVFVVYLDVYHLSIAAVRDARQPLLDFLGRTIGPSDLFAVTTPEVSGDSLVFARRTETLSNDLLDLETVAFPPDSPAARDTPRTDAERALVQNCYAEVNGNIGALLNAYRADQLMTSLEGLMIRLRALRDERKNVLFVSDGWPIGDLSNLQFQVQPSGAPPIGVGPGGHLGTGSQLIGAQDQSACNNVLARLASIDFIRRFRDLLTKARQANVTFYPINPGGLASPLNGQAATAMAGNAAANMDNLQRSEDTMRELAENTDGEVVLNTNDIRPGLKKIADDLSAYYLLGYASSNKNFDGKYRRIEVKVDVPHVDIAARRGYLAPTLAALTTSGPSAPATPSAVSAALGRLVNSRPDAELTTYAAASSTGLAVIAEIAGQQIAAGKWAKGAHLEASIVQGSAEVAHATGEIDAGARGGIVHLPLAQAGAGPWRVTVKVSGDDGTLDDRITVPAPPAELLGTPLCFRGTSSPRIPLEPVADFQFYRTERLHLEFPERQTGLDQRVARVLNREGKPLPLEAAVTERTENGQAVVVVDVNARAAQRGRLPGRARRRPQRPDRAPPRRVSYQQLVSPLRACQEISDAFGPPIHPAWRRCFSLKYTGYSRSSRLATRASRRPKMHHLFPDRP